MSFSQVGLAMIRVCITNCEYKGRYYIIRRIRYNGRIAQVTEYMHPDGLWHKSMMSETTLEIVGYFDTQEQCEALLRSVDIGWTI